MQLQIVAGASGEDRSRAVSIAELGWIFLRQKGFATVFCQLQEDSASSQPAEEFAETLL